MPELPEVKIVKQYVNPTAFHKKIDEVEIRTRDMLEGVSASEMRRALESESLLSAFRHEKCLFIKKAAGK